MANWPHPKRCRIPVWPESLPCATKHYVSAKMSEHGSLRLQGHIDYVVAALGQAQTPRQKKPGVALRNLPDVCVDCQQSCQPSAVSCQKSEVPAEG